MTQNYRNLLKETFSNPTSLTPEKLGQVVEESMKYFQDLQAKLASEDPKDREAAMNDSMELRELLEQQMAALCESTGLDPAQLSALTDDPNMSPQDQAVMDEVRTRLQTLMPKPKPKKKPTVKIVG